MCEYIRITAHYSRRVVARSIHLHRHYILPPYHRHPILPPTLVLYRRHPVLPPQHRHSIFHFTTIPPTLHILHVTTIHRHSFSPPYHRHSFLHFYSMRPTFPFPHEHPDLPPSVDFTNSSWCSYLLYVSCFTAQIGPRGAIQLGDALRHNKSLTEIDLRENSLGPAGMKSIADALAENDSMRSLHLQVCQRHWPFLNWEVKRRNFHATGATR